jgi:anti-sigma B factor antagonist
VQTGFELTTAYLGEDAYLIAVSGELDVSTGPALRDSLAAVVGDGAREVVVDLLRLAFVDSVALGVLVEASKRMAQRGGRVVLVSDDRRMARVIQITGLQRILPVSPSLRAALEGLGGRRQLAAAGR